MHTKPKTLTQLKKEMDDAALTLTLVATHSAASRSLSAAYVASRSLSAAILAAYWKAREAYEKKLKKG